MWRQVCRVVSFACIAVTIACDDPSGPSETSGEQTVTVMTYNIFHDAEQANRGIAPWSERRSAVTEAIRDRMPHVLGLQEAEVWQVGWLLEQLPEYAAVERGPFADASIDDAETVAILYRDDRFHLEDSGHFWYSDSPDSPGSYGSPEFGGMTRPRMATWVRLRPLDAPAGRGFYVFNTHFNADDSADDPSLARLKSAEVLVRRIADRAHADEHFFVAGDLNTRPGERPLEYLLGSRCEPGVECSEASAPSVRMVDAWAALYPGDSQGTRCNSVTGSEGPRVDYVLAGDPGSQLDPPSIADVEIADGADCPSDHRPVAATFSFRLDPS